MKTEEGKKIKLGVFVTLAIVLFVVAIYFIGSRQYLFSRTFELSAVFKDVAGLQAGNNVRISGINIGSIEYLEITSDSTVRVDMVIRKNAQQFIKADALATIGSEGLMGNKVINIVAGSPEKSTVENGAVLATITPVSVDEIMNNLSETIDYATIIAYDISELTTGIRAGRGAIGKLLVDSTFAQTLDQTMVNAQQATDGLNENMEAAKENFLLRGYFNKKEKEEEKEREEARKAAEEEQKKRDKEKGKGEEKESKGFLWW